MIRLAQLCICGDISSVLAALFVCGLLSNLVFTDVLQVLVAVTDI